MSRYRLNIEFLGRITVNLLANKNIASIWKSYWLSAFLSIGAAVKISTLTNKANANIVSTRYKLNSFSVQEKVIQDTDSEHRSRLRESLVYIFQHREELKT